MSYDPTIDFLALIRYGSDGASTERMPGMDYVISALSRMGLVSLFVGQTAPTVNQATTVWLKPANPSWTAEGIIFLYDANAGAWAAATPALWSAFLTAVVTPPPAPRDYAFQDVAGLSANVSTETTLLAITRNNPGVTTLQLPSAVDATKELRIIDWSTNVVAHDIAIVAAAGQTVMQKTTWHLFSTADQLAGATLYPSEDLNGWTMP